MIMSHLTILQVLLVYLTLKEVLHLLIVWFFKAWRRMEVTFIMLSVVMCKIMLTSQYEFRVIIRISVQDFNVYGWHYNFPQELKYTITTMLLHFKFIA